MADWFMMAASTSTSSDIQDETVAGDSSSEDLNTCSHERSGHDHLFAPRSGRDWCVQDEFGVLCTAVRTRSVHGRGEHEDEQRYPGRDGRGRLLVRRLEHLLVQRGHL